MNTETCPGIPKRTAVIGAGLMGTQIALVLAHQCPRVALMSRHKRSIDAAMLRAQEYAASLEIQGLLPVRADQLVSRLVPTTDLSLAIQGAEFVIESVSENTLTKRKVFADLDKSLGPEVVIASNTSALPVSELATGLRYPERVLISHFIQPAHINPVLEVVRGLRTSDQALNRTISLWKELGWLALVVQRDLPGFLINRLQHALIREAIALLAQGLASAEDIDTAVRLGLSPRFTVLGPLRQRDVNGLRMHISVAERLWPDLDGSHVPALEYLRDLVDSGAAGLENGRGFYDWSDIDPVAERARLNDLLINRVRQVVEGDDHGRTIV